MDHLVHGDLMVTQSVHGFLLMGHNFVIILLIVLFVFICIMFVITYYVKHQIDLWFTMIGTK